VWQIAHGLTVRGFRPIVRGEAGGGGGGLVGFGRPKGRRREGRK